MGRVLDLGLGEGGAVVGAPVDGLEALVDEAALVEAVEGLEHLGLVAEAHGFVGLVPAAEDAEALELAALEVDEAGGVLAAGLADGDGVHLELFAAEFLVDLDLDGEAVAVPAGDVGRVEAGHGLGLDDEVLDALVERVAEVDGAVGVGRAVVQDVLGSALAGGADLRIKVHGVPCLQARGLVGRQVGFHGKAGFGQIQGFFERPGGGWGRGLGRAGVLHAISWREGSRTYVSRRLAKLLLYGFAFRMCGCTPASGEDQRCSEVGTVRETSAYPSTSKLDREGPPLGPV